MITLDDLKIEPSVKDKSSKNSKWEQITTPDNRYFLVGNCDHSDLKNYLDIHYDGDADKLADATVLALNEGRIDFLVALGLMDGDTAGLLPEGYAFDEAHAILSGFPVKDTWVMEATPDWEILNECGPACSEGVCKKRLASNETVASQELGYKMLLDYLNA